MNKIPVVMWLNSIRIKKMLFSPLFFSLWGGGVTIL